MPGLKIKIIALPYQNFKEKIKITKAFNKKYHIEDMSMDNTRGVLYMERKRDII